MAPHQQRQNERGRKEFETNPIWPITILEKVGDDAFHLNLPTYVQIYLVMNVENQKLYEPPLIMDIEEVGQVPTLDEFSPK